MTAEFAIAQLRHLYSHMVNGRLGNPVEAAHGLLGPSIEALEKHLLENGTNSEARKLAEHINARRHHRMECLCDRCTYGGCSEQKPCENCRRYGT